MNHVLTNCYVHRGPVHTRALLAALPALAFAAIGCGTIGAGPSCTQEELWFPCELVYDHERGDECATDLDEDGIPCWADSNDRVPEDWVENPDDAGGSIEICVDGNGDPEWDEHCAGHWQEVCDTLCFSLLDYYYEERLSVSDRQGYQDYCPIPY